MYSEYLLIGEVLKPQGVRGLVKVRPETDDPARFLQLETVYLKSGDQYRPIAITNIECRTDGFVYCVLDHADDRDQAEKQRGLLLYVDRAHAVELAEGQYFISDLLECQVRDQKGNALGVIEDVLQPGANDVYQVKCPNGRRMYLPVLPFVIKAVDVKAGVIVVDGERLPEVAVFED